MSPERDGYYLNDDHMLILVKNGAEKIYHPGKDKFVKMTADSGCPETPISNAQASAARRRLRRSRLAASAPA